VAIAVIGLFNIVGTLTAGYLGKRYTKKYLLFWIYTGRTIAAAAFILLPITPASVLIFSAVMGALWLATVPLTSGLVAHIYGIRYMGTLYGVVFLSHQIGGFLGVWLGGRMYDLSGDYTLVWWIGVGVGPSRRWSTCRSASGRCWRRQPDRPGDARAGTGTRRRRPLTRNDQFLGRYALRLPVALATNRRAPRKVRPMRLGIAAPRPRLCPEPVLPRFPRGDDTGADQGPGRHGGRAGLGLGLVVPGLCRDADPDRGLAGQGGAAADHGGPSGAGGVGAVLFSQATGALQIKLAMALIGIGCAPVLMASYFIFARSYSPAVFGTLAALTLGVGTLGNVASSLPLSWAVTAFGWRETVLGIAAVTGAVALAILFLVRDPERLEGARGGSLLELLKMPVLWPILIMMMVCYAPIAGLRGLWIGPYFSDVHGREPA
jgi:predicted MFS family arabinose efflux permease